MKHLNIAVFAIVAVAVLVMAYGVGLLVRQARTPDVVAPSQPVAEPNTACQPDPVAASRQRIGQGRAEPTEAEKAALEQKRAEQLARMRNMTEEEKQEFRNSIRRQVTGDGESQGRRSGPRPVARRTTTAPSQTQEQPNQSKAIDPNAPVEPNGIDQSENPTTD